MTAEKVGINRLAVHPNHRGEGIAKALVDAVENKLNNIGIDIIAALIEEFNANSMNLFEGLGYKIHKDIFYFSKRKDTDI